MKQVVIIILIVGIVTGMVILGVAGYLYQRLQKELFETKSAIDKRNGSSTGISRDDDLFEGKTRIHAEARY